MQNRIECDYPEDLAGVSIHPDVTFHQLHRIIQSVMGWENHHLYEFHVKEKVIGLPDPTFELFIEDREELNARREIVRQHVQEENTVFTYVYDFGDGWQHTVTLIKIDASMSDPVPLCLDGARCCPLEDVGGIWRYQHLMEVLLTSDHPEREQFMDWGGEGYDPEHFSCEEVNQELERQKDKLIPKSMVKRPVRKKPVKLTKSALTKHLKQLNNDQLIDLVKACYDVSKDMEKFLSARILGDEAEHAISEFERLTGNPKYVLELKLVYVENGVDYTLIYGDIDERFYYSMASMYADIIDHVNEDETAEFFDEFEERLEAVVLKTEGIGWSFHDNLAELHAQLR